MCVFSQGLRPLTTRVRVSVRTIWCVPHMTGWEKMDASLSHADLKNTVMAPFPNKFMSNRIIDKTYWIVNPTDPVKQKDSKFGLGLRIHKTIELFQEVVYLTAVLLHVGHLKPEEVSDNTDLYFKTLRDRAKQYRSSFFNENTFDSFKYYKTKASRQNIILFLTLCGKTVNGNQKLWLEQVYDSENIIKIFFPNLYNTNVRTLSTSLKGFSVLQTEARSTNVLSRGSDLVNPYVYMECNPFTIFKEIHQQLRSPKLYVMPGINSANKLEGDDVSIEVHRDAYGPASVGGVSRNTYPHSADYSVDLNQGGQTPGSPRNAWGEGLQVDSQLVKKDTPVPLPEPIEHKRGPQYWPSLQSYTGDTSDEEYKKPRPKGNPRGAWIAQDDPLPPVDTQPPNAPVVPAQSKEEPVQWAMKRGPQDPKPLVSRPPQQEVHRLQRPLSASR